MLHGTCRPVMAAHVQVPVPGAVGDRLAQPWVAVAKSLWHGPNQEGR